MPTPDVVAVTTQRNRIGAVTTRAAALAIAAMFLLLAAAPAASAHSGVQSYVYLEIYETEIAGRVEFPVRDINDVLGLDLPQDEDAATALIEDNLALLQAYAAEHVAFARDFAAQQRCDEVVLTVWTFNEEALAFYRAIGFRPLTTTLGIAPQPS